MTFETFLGGHEKSLCGIAKRYARNSDEADDIAQEIRLRLLGKFSQLQGESNAYARSAMHNRAKEVVRRERWRQPLSEFENQACPDTLESEVFETLPFGRQVAEVSGLELNQNELSVLEGALIGEDQEETGARLNRNVNWVKKTLFGIRARARAL